MLPPPPPAFGGVVVSGGGGTRGTPSAAGAGAPPPFGASSPSASPFAPPGPPQRIDPAQIPRPAAAAAAAGPAAPSAAADAAADAASPPRPIMHRTRSAPSQQQEGFSQQQQQQQDDRHVPPPPTSAFADCPGVAVADGGDASFRAMRPTLHALPRSRDLPKSVGIPLEVLVTPLAAPLPGDDAIPLLDFGAHGPPRCKGCRAYVNPGFAFLDGGASFECNLCGEVSPVPVEYSAAGGGGGGGGRLVGAVGPGASASGADAALERAAALGGPAAAGAELARGSYEFLAPAAFCARAPRPPARLFVIDASFGAGACGLTAASCRAAAAAIRAVAAQAGEARELEGERERRLLASGGGGGGGRGGAAPSPCPPTLVGLMSFGAAGLHFYSFGTGGEGEAGGGGSGGGGRGAGNRGEGEGELLSSSLEPSVLVVPDVDAPFSPVGRGLFVDVSPSLGASERRLGAMLALLERVPALHGVGGVAPPRRIPPLGGSPTPRPPPARPSRPGLRPWPRSAGGASTPSWAPWGPRGPAPGRSPCPGGAATAPARASPRTTARATPSTAATPRAPPRTTPPRSQPPPAPWRALAEFAAERQVGVDVHLAPPAGTRPDGAGARAAAALCSATGGELRLHPRWSPPPAGAVCDLSEAAVEAVGCGVGTSSRGRSGGGSGGDGGGEDDARAPPSPPSFFEPGVAHGWEAVGRLRVSRGLEVLSYSGPVHRRTPLDVDFPCLGPATTVRASLGLDGRSLPGGGARRPAEAALQFAVAFTHAASGSRRVRVHTLRLPVAEGAAQVFRGADVDALLACGAREVAAALRGSRRVAAAVGGGKAGASRSCRPRPGLLLRAGSAASLAGASASSAAAAAEGGDPSALPASIVASSSSSAPRRGAEQQQRPGPAGRGPRRGGRRGLSQRPASAPAPASSRRSPLTGSGCAATAAGGQLILPEALKLAPLAALALSKHPAVAARGGEAEWRWGWRWDFLAASSSPAPPQDERAAAAAALARAPRLPVPRPDPEAAAPAPAPRRRSLQQQQSRSGTSEGGERGRCSRPRPALAAAALGRGGRRLGGLLLDLRLDRVLHAGGRADPRLVEALGMHRAAREERRRRCGRFVVKVPGSAASALLWSMVEEVVGVPFFFIFFSRFFFFPFVSFLSLYSSLSRALPLSVFFLTRNFPSRFPRLPLPPSSPNNSSLGAAAQGSPCARLRPLLPLLRSSQQPLLQHQHYQQPPPLLATSALARLLPEDRSAAGPSYVEYLCWLHRQIQKRLM